MQSTRQYPDSVVKAYDIRGTVPDNLNADFARALGGALAAQAHAHGVSTLVVGRDGRLSSEDLSQALQDGILDGGIDTLDIGQVPTPSCTTRHIPKKRAPALPSPAATIRRNTTVSK